MSTTDPLHQLTANERLTQSRERMSYWLNDDEREARANGNSRTTERGDDHPVSVGGIVREVISEWWDEHPLHASATLAFKASRIAIVPLVRRHPAAVLGGAAVVGAVIIWARPWRWLLRPALVAGVASQLAARAIARMATASRPIG